MSRVMGIDYGQKRIGIAISDELHLFASPYQTIINSSNQEVYEQLIDIINREKISRIVVGLPSHKDGTPSEQTAVVKAFIRKLKSHLTIPVDTFDERYSSCEANEVLIQKGVSLKKSKEKIDQIAAAIILQNYLNNEEREI